MTNKAYIVVNEQQEREVLEKLEQEAVTWWLSLKPASQFIPSKYSPFPYGLKILGSYVVFASLDRLEGYEIVYGGRKEEKMSDKYVVSQEFMNELKEWKSNLVSYDEHSYFIDGDVIEGLPVVVNAWWGDEVPDEENNNRLIAIIRWVNGEDVFEVEKHKKWIVRSKDTDVQGDYWYVYAYNTLTSNRFTKADATRFNSKEEAESWANSHQEVIEVVDV